MIKRPINNLIITLTLTATMLAGGALMPALAQAATLYWVGGNGDSVTGNANDWSTTNPAACNNGGGNASAVPGASDVATFDPDCDNNATITANWSVEGIDMQSGYAGTLTQNGGVTVTIGTSGYSQAGGTFNGGTGAITINGAYTLTGGAFTSTSGNLILGAPSSSLTIFSQTSGTFNHNNGTVAFTGSPCCSNYNFTIDVPTSITFNNLTMNIVNQPTTIASGDTLVVLGTFTHTHGYVATGTIEAHGPVVVGASASGGDATLSFVVAGDQTISSSGGTTVRLIVNKPSDAINVTGNLGIGALTLTNGTFNSTSGNLTIFPPSSSLTVFSQTSGTFNHNNGSLAFAGSPCCSGYTFTIDVATSVTFNNLTMNILNQGTWIASGDTLVVTGTFAHLAGSINTGTIEARGNVGIGASANGGTALLTFAGAMDQTYLDNSVSGPGGDVTINKTAGTVTLASNANWNAAGQDLVITAGTLDQGTSYNLATGAITVGGTGVWINEGNGDITLGGNVTNSGTITINANGGDCGSDDIVISSTGGVRTWTNSGTLTLIDVSASNMADSSILAYSSVNAGSSTWTFNASCPTTTDVLGRIYTDEGTTPLNCSTPRTVNLKLNGAGAYTAECSNTPVNGTYAINNVPFNVGDIITVYLENETENAVTVTRAGTMGVDMTGINLYQDHMIVRSEDGNPLTIDQMANYDSDQEPDGDIFFDAENAATDTLNVTTGVMYVTGTTTVVAPGGSITLDYDVDFKQVNGTFNGGSDTLLFQGGFVLAGGTFNSTSDTLYVGQDAAGPGWAHTAGTFTHNNGTVVWTGYDNNFNPIAGETLYNFEINCFLFGDCPANFMTLNGTVIVLNDFTHTDGNVATGNIEVRGDVFANTADGATATMHFLVAGNQTITSNNASTLSLFINKPSDAVTINGADMLVQSVTLVAGTLTAPTDTLTVGPDGGGIAWAQSAAGTFVHNNGTVVWGGYDNTFDVSSSATFYNFEVNCYIGDCAGNVMDLTTNGTVVVLNDFTHTDGALNTGHIEVQGDIRIGSTADIGTATMYLLEAGDQTISSAGGSTVNLYVDKPSDDVSVISSDLRVLSLTLVSGTFIAPSGTFTVGADGGGTAWSDTSSGTFLHNNGTVVWTGYDNTFAISPSETFYNFEVNCYVGDCGGNTMTMTSGGTAIVLNDFTFTDGVLNGNPMEVQGDIFVNPTADGGNVTLDITGGNAQTYTDAGGNELDGSIIVNKSAGALTLATNADWNAAGQDLTVVEGTLILVGGDLLVDDQFLIQDGSVFINTGDETVSDPDSFASGTTVIYTATSGTRAIRSGAWNYWNLIMNGAGGTFTVSGAEVIRHDLTIAAGTLDFNNQTVSIQGDTAISGGALLSGNNVVNFGNAAGDAFLMSGGSFFIQSDNTVTDILVTAGTVTVSGGAITYSSAVAISTDILSLFSPYFTLAVNAVGSTYTLQTDTDVNGDFIFYSGTVDASLGDNFIITLAGNWDNAGGGTFVPRSGTVTFDGGTQSIGGNTAFHNFEKRISSATSLIFVAGSTQTVSGTLTLQGVSGQMLSLVSNAPGVNWNIDPTGARDVNFVNVQDSLNPGATIDVRPPLTATDLGHNYGWLFADPPTINWVGKAANNNWSSALNWEPAFVPTITDYVLFNNASIKACTVDVTVNIAGLLVTNGYLGTITQNGTMNIGDSGFEWDGTSFIGGTRPITVTGSFVQNGGTFTSTSGTFTVGEDWTYTAGIFNGNNGTVTMNGTTGGLTVSTSQPFYNLSFDGVAGAWSALTNLTAANDLSVLDGTFDTDGYDLVVGGQVTIRSTLDAGPGTDGNTTLKVNGGWDMTGGVFTNTDSTVVLTSTGAASIYSDSKPFNNLIINDGLVAYWKFDETTADSCPGGVNDACDVSGGAHDGFWQNAATGSATIPPLNFQNPASLTGDGIIDLVAVPDHPDFDVGSTLTVSAWVKTANPSGYVFYHYDGPPYDGYAFGLGLNCGPGVISFWNSGTGAWRCGTNALNLDRWIHIAAVLDGPNLTLYANGSVEAVYNAEGVTGNSSQYFLIGWVFGGNLDDLRLYDRALSLTEIRRLSTGIQPSTAAGTITLEDDLDVNGTLVLATGELDSKAGENNDIHVSGSWWNYGGVYTARGNTTTFDSTATGNVIQSNGILESFNTVFVDGAGGGWSLADNLSATGTVHLDDGTLTHTNQIKGITITGSLEVDGGTFTSGGNGLAIDGNLSLLSGTFTAPDDLMVLSGNFRRTAGTFNDNGGEVVFSSEDDETITSNTEIFNDIAIGDGLIGYWKFDETALDSCSGGEDACDSSGYGSHGTEGGNILIHPQVAPVSFRNERSLFFDGTDDFIDVANESNFDFDRTDPFTISAWAYYVPANAGYVIVSKTLNGGNFPGLDFAIDATNERLRVIFTGAAGGCGVDCINNSTAAVTLSSLAWHHIAVTYDGSSMAVGMRLFIDGVDLTQVGGSDISSSPLNNTPVRIGHNPAGGGGYLNGLLDDVRIYSRALSAEEINILARLGVVGHTTTTTEGTMTLEDALDVNGTLVLASGKLDTKFGENNEIAVGGSWLNFDGVFTAQSATVTFDAASGTHRIISDTDAFQDVIFDGVSATWRVGDAMDVNGLFTVTNGSVDLNTYDPMLNVADNFTVQTTGTFMVGAGTVTFDGDLLFADVDELTNIGTLVVGSSPDTTTLTTDLNCTHLLIEAGDTLITNGYDVSCTGNVTIEGTLNASPGADGNSTITVGGTWTIDGGLFTSTNSTVVFNGSGLIAAITSDGQSFHNVVFNDGGILSQWRPADAMSLTGSLTLVSGQFDANDQALTINGNTVINNATMLTGIAAVTFGNAPADSFTMTAGTLYIESDNTVTDLIVNAQTLNNTGGTIIYNSATPVSTDLESALSAYFNLVIDSAGSTYTLDGTLDIDGDFTLVAGTVDAGLGDNYGITIAGDWSNSDTFVPRSGTVEFDGDDQSINGDSDFFNFAKSVTTAATLTFEAGSHQTMSGTFTVVGASGQHLGLVSSIPGTLWNFDPTGLRVANFVTVRDSLQPGATIDVRPPLTAVDLGHNYGWLFQDPTVINWVGKAADNNWSSALNWEPATVPTSADAVLFNNASIKFATVNVTANMAQLIVTDGYLGTITQSAAMNIGAGGFTWAGNNFVGGTQVITVTGSFTQTAGVFISTSGTFYVGEDWLNTSGTFNHNNGTVQMIGTTGGHTIATDQDFYNLSVNGIGGSWTQMTPISIDNNLSIFDGTFITNGYDYEALGDVTISGTLNAGPGADGNTTMRVSGNWDMTGGLFMNTDSTVLLNGTMTSAIYSGAASFNNLMINDGLVGYWKFEEAGANACSNGVNDSCDSSGYAQDGTWEGNATASTSAPPVNFEDQRSLVLDGNGDYLSVPDSDRFSFGDGSNDRPFSVSVWVNSNDWTHNGIISRYDFPASNAEWLLLTSSGDQLYFALYDDDNANWIGRSSFITLTSYEGTWAHIAVVYDGSGSSNGIDLYVNGVVVDNDDFNNGSYTAMHNEPVPLEFGRYNGAAVPYLNGKLDEVRIYDRALSAAEVRRLAHGNQPSTSLGTVTLEDALDINGTLVLGAGELDTKATEDNSVNVAGNWLNYGGVFTANEGIVTFDGTTSGLIIQSNGMLESFNTVFIDGAGGGWTLNDNLSATGTINLDDGTLTYTGDVTGITITGSLELNGGTFTSAGTGFLLDGSLALLSGTFTAPDDVLAISGNFLRTAGTFNDNGGEVIFSSADDETITSNTESFNDVLFGDGLIGYWKLDETAFNGCVGGQDACDSSGNGNHGIESGTPTISSTSAPVNFSNERSFQFDGINDRIDYGDNGNFDFGTRDFSYSFWMQSTATSDQQMLYKRGSPQGYNIALLNTGVVQAVIADSNGFVASTSATVLNNNVWHHIAVTYNRSGNMILYVNGVQEDSDNILAISGSISTATNFFIGGEAPQWFNGSIDDVRIYNRVLSADEVALLTRATVIGHSTTSTEGTMTLEDALDVNGTLTFASGWLDVKSGEDNPIAVGGSWLNVGGTFEAQTGTVTFDAVGGTHQIVSGAEAFHHMLFDGVGATWIARDAMEANGVFTVANGNLDLATDDPTLNVAGDFTVETAGVFTVGGGAVIFDGDLLFADEDELTNMGTLIIGSSPDTTILTTDLNCTNLTIDPGDSLITDGYEINCTGSITINGTLDATAGANGNTTVTLGGTWDMTGGLFLNSDSTVTFNGTSGTYAITSDGKSFDNVKFNGTSGVWQPQDALDIDGTLAVAVGTLSGTQSILVSGGHVTGNGSILTAGGTFTVDGAGNFGGNTAWTFNNLRFGDGAGATATTAIGTGTITIDGSLTVASNQTLNAGAKNWNLTASGGVTYVIDTFTDAEETGIEAHSSNMSGAWIEDQGNMTVRNNRIEAFTFFGGNWSHNAVTPASADYEVSADVIWDGASGSGLTTGVVGRMSGAHFLGYQAAYNENVQEWQLIVWSGGNPTTLGTFAQPYVQGETHNVKLWMQGTTIRVYVDGILRINVTNAVVAAANSCGLLLETGNPPSAIPADNYRCASLSGGYGPFVVNGSFNANTSTVNFMGKSTTTIPALTYYNLAFVPETGGPTYALGAGTLNVNSVMTVGDGTNMVNVTAATGNPAIDIDGDITLSASGTLTASGTSIFTIAGDWSNAGTFIHNNGSVTFNSAGVSTISGTTTFYELINVTAGSEMDFGANQTFGIAGSLILTGTSADRIILDSSNGSSRFTLSVSAAQTVNFVDVSNSQVSGSADIVANYSIDNTNTDSGEASPHWVFPATPLYRSVGITATDLNVNNRTVTISGTVATFSAAMPDIVGVGDILQYPVGAPTSLAVIAGRVSSTVYTVTGTDGASPPTAAAGGTNVDVFRAYTSLFNWEAQDENDSLDNTLENFDTITDLVSNSLIMAVAAYGDGDDTAAVDIAGWTTGPNNYIQIYTPVNSAEVGISQRHAGIWDTSKYYRTMNVGNQSIDVQVNYVRIIGLQISIGNTNSIAVGIQMNQNGTSGLQVRSNIIRSTVAAQGGGIFGGPSAATAVADNVFVNNIVYGFTGAGGSGIYMRAEGSAGASIYYNNTVYDSDTCFRARGAYTEAKNNVAFACSGTAYLETSQFAVATHNAYGSGSDPGTNGINLSGYSVDQIFANTASKDLHLALGSPASDRGTDLSVDGTFAFSDDIDGDTRPAGIAWDIGADEAAAVLHRSVGITATDLNVNNRTVTISGTMATFSAAMPDNVGVGDILQYPAGAPASLAVIVGRVSSTVYEVMTTSGTGAPTAAVAGTQVDVFRAYTSLFNWEAQDENNVLDNALENFDTSTDLATDNTVMNVAAYGDGVDTTGVTIDGWTTGINNFIRIYTPTSTNEVGTSQRHHGKWSDSAYQLVRSSIGANLDIADQHVRLEGLQIGVNGNGGEFAIRIASAISYEDLRISNNIIREETASTGDNVAIILSSASSNHNIHVANNVIYGFKGAASLGIRLNSCGTSCLLYVYNNTVYGVATAYSQNAGTYIAKNNMAQNTTNGFGGTFSAASNYNISDIASDAPSSSYRSGLATTVNFVDSVKSDFHLALNDTRARDVGTDLSVDGTLALSDDVDGNTRPTGAVWDLGADEAAVGLYRSVGITTTDLNTSIRMVTISGTVATFSAAMPDNVGVGDILQYPAGAPASLAVIVGRVSSTVYYVRATNGYSNPTAAGGGTAVNVFRAYTSLFNWEAQDENNSLDNALENFDTLTDLVTNNTVMNVAAYGDGADTTNVDISGWSTGANNYIRVYTPTSTTEVGTRQRHSGKWDTAKYYLETTTDWVPVILVNEDHVRVEGLQLHNAATGNPDGIIYTGNGELRVSYSILRDGRAGLLAADTTGNTLTYWNNILYNFNGSCIYSFNSVSDTTDLTAYNNTLINCGSAGGGQGIYVQNYRNVALKNNLAQGLNGELNYNLIGNVSTVTSNNLSEDATSPNGAYQNSRVIFTDEAGHDFHLAPYDVEAKNQGTSLTADGTLAFSDDIEGNTRPQFSVWDIGADEVTVNGTTYTWTGAFNAVTWKNQGNWDSGDGSAGNDGYPDDNKDKALIISTAHSISVIGTVTVGELEISGSYTGTTTMSGTTTFTVDDAVGGTGDMLFTAAGTITHTDNTTVAAGQKDLTLTIDGSMTIGDNAKFSATGRGYNLGEGTGAGGFSLADGGSYGGLGGDRNSDQTVTLTTYGSMTAPTLVGSGGSFSGGLSRDSGGGAIMISVSGTTTLNGTIAADGVEDVTAGTGGGSGGSVYLTTAYLTGSGTITANGGDSSSSIRAAGGGGRVAVILTGSGAGFTSFTGTMVATGGNASSNTRFPEDGAAGTVYQQTTAQGAGNGTLIINNGAEYAYEGGGITTAIPSGETWDSDVFDTLVLNNGGNLGVGTGETFNKTGITITGDTGDSNEGITLFGGTYVTDAAYSYTDYHVRVTTTSTFNPSTSTSIGNNAQLMIDVAHTLSNPLTIQSGGNLTHGDNSVDTAGIRTFKMNLTVPTLTVNAGGQANVDSIGFDRDQGPANPPNGSGDGGTHGGIGADNALNGTVNTLTYGSVTAPVTLGSGGDAGAGGGAIRLTVSGTTTLNGPLTSSGFLSGAGAGSGGSIYLTTGFITGSSNITANGGDGNGGGGGRVAVILTGANATFSSYSGTMTALGGNAAGANLDGAAGTVYTQTTAQGATNGTLLINNNNRDAYDTADGGLVNTTVNGTVTGVDVGSVTIKGAATLQLSGTLQTFTVTGTWLNQAKQTVTAGTVLLDRSGAQAVTTNGGTFYDLQITNASTSGVRFIDATGFHNFKDTAPNSVITFDAGSSYPISGTLNLNGQDGLTLITITSDAPPTRFSLVPASAQSVSYVSVNNSNANSNNISTSFSTDNNTDSGEAAPHWIFGGATTGPKRGAIMVVD